MLTNNFLLFIILLCILFPSYRSVCWWWESVLNLLSLFLLNSAWRSVVVFVHFLIMAMSCVRVCRKTARTSSILYGDDLSWLWLTTTMMMMIKLLQYSCSFSLPSPCGNCKFCALKSPGQLQVRCECNGVFFPNQPPSRPMMIESRHQLATQFKATHRGIHPPLHHCTSTACMGKLLFWFNVLRAVRVCYRK